MNDATKFIADQIRSIPKLSAPDEYELAVRARAGDKAAANALVEANLRHALNVALKYRHYGIPVEELLAEGSLGLLAAVNKFDPEKGVRFITYAGYWIRAFVLDKVVRSRRMVGGGSGPFRSKLFFRLRRERAAAASITPDAREQIAIVAKRIGLPESKVDALYKRLHARDVSLNAPLDQDGNGSMMDMLTSDESSEVMAIRNADADTLREAVSCAMETLDKREKLIIEHRHLQDTQMSLASLGRLLGVSRERARQLETRAKEKLRKSLGQYAEAA